MWRRSGARPTNIVTIAPPPAAAISGSDARAAATSEYALMSTAIQKRSRGVSVKRPSRSSAAANATEWTSRSSPPSHAAPTSANTRSRSSSARTSHAVTSFESTDDASSRTLDSIRSPWKVKASSAPSSARRRAMAQAIDRLLATPMIRARLPANRDTSRSYGYCAVRAPPRGISRAQRGARSHGHRVRGLSTGGAPSRRGRDPARARGDDHRPGRAPQGPRHRHPHAGRATARRVLPDARRLERHAPAECRDPERQGLRREAPQRPASRRRDAEACDSVGARAAQLHGAAQRHRGRHSYDRAGPRREALVRAEALSQLPVLARSEPQSRTDRG